MSKNTLQRTGPALKTVPLNADEPFEAITMFSFSALVVCTDPVPLGVTNKVLEEYGVNVKHAPSTLLAGQLIQRNRFDLAIYDSEVPGAMELSSDYSVPAPRIVLALVPYSGARSVQGRRVHFMMQKPFSADLLSKTLRAAYGPMLKEKRSTYRHNVTISPSSCSLKSESGQKRLVGTKVLNISQNGLCLNTAEMLQQHSTLELEFSLPELSGPLQVHGEVMWTREGRAGIQFKNMQVDQRKELSAWLDSKFHKQMELTPRPNMAMAR